MILADITNRFYPLDQSPKHVSPLTWKASYYFRYFSTNPLSTSTSALLRTSFSFNWSRSAETSASAFSNSVILSTNFCRYLRAAALLRCRFSALASTSSLCEGEGSLAVLVRRLRLLDIKEEAVETDGEAVNWDKLHRGDLDKIDADDEALVIIIFEESLRLGDEGGGSDAAVFEGRVLKV